MKDNTPCVGCLRRSWLLSLLGPYTERVAPGLARRHSSDLLQLGDEALVEAVAQADGEELIARVAAMDEPWFAERLAETETWAICRHDAAYPPGLKDLDPVPAALFGRGERSAVAGLAPEGAVAILGSRRATSYGREVARSVGNDVGGQGITVVSGLAFGIDACAHRGAIDVAAPTVAVLACGPDVAYPAAHQGLWRRIAEQGAVVSEMPPGSIPWRWSFPARSRVIAALTAMTVVVEAASRSGSLVAAEVASDLGRTVGAVPGPVIAGQGCGPNGLLAEGATVVRDGRDIVEALPYVRGQGPSAYTGVGRYGRSESPFVETVRTAEGPVAALALVREPVEAEGGAGLGLRIDALLHGEATPVDLAPGM